MSVWYSVRHSTPPAQVLCAGALISCLGLVRCSSRSGEAEGIPDPTVESVSPHVQLENEPLPVTIQGRHFIVKVTRQLEKTYEFEVDEAFVAILHPSSSTDGTGSPVFLMSVHYIDDKTLTATVPPDVDPGLYDLEVITPYGLSDVLEKSFTVSWVEEDTATELNEDTASHTDTGSDADADVDADTDVDTDTDVDSDTDIDVDTDTDVDTDADTDADTDTDSDSDSISSTDTETDLDAGTDNDTESEPDSDRDTGTATEIDTPGVCGPELDPDWDGLCNSVDDDDDNDGCPDDVDPIISAYATLDLLLVVADANEFTPEWDMAPGDDALLAMLEEMGHRVTPFFCSNATSNAAAYQSAIDPDYDTQPNFDVVFISESCDPNTLDPFGVYVMSNFSVGQVTNEDGLFQAMDLSTDIAGLTCPQNMDIIDPSHFITAPFGQIEVALFPDLGSGITPCISTATDQGAVAPDLNILGVATGTPANKILFYVDAGAQLLNFNTANARLVGFGPTYIDNPNLTWNGFTKGIFYRALLYAAGRDRDHDADGDLMGDDCDPDFPGPGL